MIICSMFFVCQNSVMANQNEEVDGIYQKLEVEIPIEEAGCEEEFYPDMITENGFYIVQLQDKRWRYGLITFDGKLYWDEEYKIYEEMYGNSLRPEKNGEKYGYVDEKGEWIIPPVFTFGDRFRDGIATVRFFREGREKKAYIDTTGKILYEVDWMNENNGLLPFEGGYGEVKEDNKIMVFNTQMEKCVEMENCLDFKIWDRGEGKESYYCYISSEEPTKMYIKNFQHEEIGICELNGFSYDKDLSYFSINPIGSDFIEVEESKSRSKDGNHGWDTIIEIYDKDGEKILEDQYGIYQQFGDKLMCFLHGLSDYLIGIKFLDAEGKEIGEYLTTENGELRYEDELIWDFKWDKKTLKTINPVTVLYPESCQIQLNHVPEKREEERGEARTYISEIGVYVDEEKIEFDVKPEMEADRVLVPMRGVFEALGAEVTWDEERNTAIAKKGADVKEITIGSDVMMKNGESIALDVTAKMKEDRTLLPLRAVSEALGAKVEWEEVLERVYIYTDSSEEEAMASSFL